MSKESNKCSFLLECSASQLMKMMLQPNHGPTLRNSSNRMKIACYPGWLTHIVVLNCANKYWIYWQLIFDVRFTRTNFWLKNLVTCSLWLPTRQIYTASVTLCGKSTCLFIYVLLAIITAPLCLSNNPLVLTLHSVFFDTVVVIVSFEWVRLALSASSYWPLWIKPTSVHFANDSKNI